MQNLICKQIDDTDFYYFISRQFPDTVLFTVFTDDLDTLLGADGYTEVLDAIRTGGKAEIAVTVVVS